MGGNLIAEDDALVKNSTILMIIKIHDEDDDDDDQSEDIRVLSLINKQDLKHVKSYKNETTKNLLNQNCDLKTI